MSTLKSPITNHILPFLKPLLPSPTTSTPLVIAISGIQGSGKTTAAHALAQTLTSQGYKATSCSIDDFYLPRREQLSLAERNAGNGLLQRRGMPGTFVSMSVMRRIPTCLNFAFHTYIWCNCTHLFESPSIFSHDIFVNFHNY